MRMFQTTFHAMGGENLIVIAASEATSAQVAMEAAAREVLRIQDKYSRYRTDDQSIVHQINRRAGKGEWTACDSETITLLQIADRFHHKSGGLFDITSGVLRKIWDFKAEIVPTSEQIAATLTLIGWRKVEFDGARIRLPLAGMEIDFGGFGKEYAADKAAATLREHGVSAGFVNLGGDIHAIGPQLDGQGWRIGVEDPRAPGQLVSGITLSYGGLATSGDAQKFFIKDGTRYSHILSPVTGLPVNCWSSVSVNRATTLEAGFYSTTAMLMEEAGQGFLRESKCSFLLIDRDGTAIQSDDLDQETKNGRDEPAD